MTKKIILEVSILLLVSTLLVNASTLNLKQGTGGEMYSYSDELKPDIHRWKVSRYVLNNSHVTELIETKTNRTNCNRGDMYIKPIGSACPIIEGSIIQIEILGDLSDVIPISTGFSDSLDTTASFKSSFNEYIDENELPNLPFTKNFIHPITITFDNQTSMSSWEYKIQRHGPNHENSSMILNDGFLTGFYIHYNQEDEPFTRFTNFIDIETGIVHQQIFEIFSWGFMIQFDYITDNSNDDGFLNFSSQGAYIGFFIVILTINKRKRQGYNSQKN